MILANLELQKERNLKDTSPREKMELSPPPTKMKNSNVNPSRPRLTRVDKGKKKKNIKGAWLVIGRARQRDGKGEGGADGKSKPARNDERRQYFPRS